ncbi:MAG: hypothetical protein NC082_04050 [Clostridiales bacterium]|nr:hypothetical protein [Clostridiales bacterium]
MSIIPDYARQGIELMRQLEGQAELTAQYWSDGKRKEYYDKFILPYLSYLETYVYGTGSLRGKGLNDLLEFVSTKIDEFEDAAESSITGDIIAPSYSTNAYSHGQILAPTEFDSKDMRDVVDTPSIDVPSDRDPSRLSDRRATWTVDYNLNGPGEFSAENLRNILKRRRNG